MEHRRRSKRIEDQSKSPKNKGNNAEDKVERKLRSDIAKVDDKLSSIIKMLPDTKELSTKLTLLEGKVDGIGRVVFGGKSVIQKIAEDVENIRSDNVGNTNLMLDLSLTQDRSESLRNVVLNMYDTLQSIAEAQERIHSKVFGYTSPRSEATASVTADRITDIHHPAMKDHVKNMERKFAHSVIPPGMSIKTFALEMTKYHEEISYYGGNTSEAILKRNFIKGLGRPFIEVLHDLLEDRLAPEWQSLDLDELVPVAEEYLNTKPSSSLRKRKYASSDDDSD